MKAPWLLPPRGAASVGVPGLVGLAVVAASATAYILYGYYPAVVDALNSDSLGFMRAAQRLAADMAAQGVGAWHLRPGGQAPAGLMAPVVSLGVGPAGAAAVHAAVIVCAVALATRSFAAPFSAGGGVASLSVFLLPTVAMAVLIVHKDGLYVAGVVLLFGAFHTALADPDARPVVVRAIGAAVIGVALAWTVRPYSPRLLLLVCVVYVSWIAANWVMGRWRRAGVCPPRMLGALLPVGAAAGVCALLMIGPDVEGGAAFSDVRGAAQTGPADRCARVIPGPVDAQLRKLEALRQHAYQRYPDAELNVGADRTNTGTCDRLATLAWAVQPALLVPYLGRIWHVGDAGLPARLAVAGQALIHAGALLALLLLPLAGRMRAAALPLGVSLFALAVITAYAVPNLGTLVRMYAAYDAVALLGVMTSTVHRRVRSDPRRPDA